MKGTVIVWFRNDLRLHDNEALSLALASSDHVIPVYIFDPRSIIGKTSYELNKSSAPRLQFTIDAVLQLRESLLNKGLNLYVRTGHPEDEVFDIATRSKARCVFANRERTQEEVDVQDALEEKLWTKGQELHYTRGKMLYYTSDLPFPISHVPDQFISFKKEVERFIPIRQPLNSPELLHPFMPSDEIDWGHVPCLDDFGLKLKYKHHLKGGEKLGLQRLSELVSSSFLSKYKEDRKQIELELTSNISPYVSLGCLSPKRVYAEISTVHDSSVKEGVNQFINQLMYRDFLRLQGKKHGNNIFKVSGIKNKSTTWEDNPDFRFKILNGKTGIPIIDAICRNLIANGNITNRSRKILASFIVNDLKLNWLFGAELFESYLLDYDPCSNYVNWNYFAGIDNDNRERPAYNVIREGLKYDTAGDYIKKWVPELEQLNEEHIHRPFLMNKEETASYNFELGSDYNHPILIQKEWKYL